MQSPTTTTAGGPVIAITGPPAKATDRTSFPIVIVGHVDHGKSTVIGRLLADTGSLPEGRLDRIRERCRRTSKPFEYAFLLDALRDEQAQGITIDSARVFFRSERRHYLIIDAPGHIEFLKNMVTGASRAHAALLVIDAAEGVRENSRRHGYVLSMLGVRQMAVLVNKMDLAGYEEHRFNEIVAEFAAFLASIRIEPAAFIPVSASAGENIAFPGSHMPWYNGPTVLELLDSLRPPSSGTDLPFRMPVQDVFKFTAFGDQRRIIAGSVTSGELRVGDKVVFYPSGKTSQVSTLEAFPPGSGEKIVRAGEAAGFTLEEQLYVGRGQLACRNGERPPHVGSAFRVSLFWLGRDPMHAGRRYVLRTGTTKVDVFLESITRLIDASSLEEEVGATQIGRHDVAECVLRCEKPVAFDVEGELADTSRFVIVDDFEIRGGGIILAPVEQPAWLCAKAAKHEKTPVNAQPLPPPGDPRLRLLGILAENRSGLYTVRRGTPLGILHADQLRALGDLAERWGEGRVHFTVRQSPEITGVPYQNLAPLITALEAQGMTAAGSGPRIRTVIGCLGREVNATALVDTQELGLRLDRRLRGLDCPAKFKLAIAGCPNDCPRAKVTDLGLVGTARPVVSPALCVACGACKKRCRQKAISVIGEDASASIDEELCLRCGACRRVCRRKAIALKEPMFAVYVGGQGGRNARLGWRLPYLVAPHEAEALVDRILDWYLRHGRRGERIGTTLERLGNAALAEWLRVGGPCVDGNGDFRE